MRFRMPTSYRRQTMGRSRGGLKGRLMIALAIAGFAFFSYLSSGQTNAITGETQYVAISEDQEIALGLQAAPEMARQHGGLYPDAHKQVMLKTIGERLVRQSVAAQTDWQFDFHLLRDSEMVNAFALPGGQVFMTYGLFKRLKTEDQIAGVLGHEIGHVIARHGAQQMAKQKLTSGLTGAAVVAAGDQSAGHMAAMVGRMVNMKYGREDELESDMLGVRFMHEAGYDPNALIDVMRVLEQAGGGARQAEFFSTHPNPQNRIQKIKEAITRL